MRPQPHMNGRRVLAALIAAFLLCSSLGTLPAFASAAAPQAPASGSLTCWPFWPFCWPSTPTPTPGVTPTSGVTSTPTSGVTPTSTSTPTHGVTPTPGATSTPGTTSGTGTTPTPTPTPTLKKLSDTSSFTVTATKIVGTNARLDLLADPLYPVLTFESVTIEGLKITHLSLVLSFSGTVTGTGASIKTSLFTELVSALGSFANKADLITLTLGGTVPTLVMNNVSLQVDRYMDLQSGTLPGLTVSY